MKKNFLVSIIATILICSLAGVGTMAYFTSQSTSEENTFVTGTLVLGGVVDNQDVENQFAKLTFNDLLQPGQPPTQMGTTTLKNVGSLPFYLYRITASGLVDNNIDNGIDDTALDEALVLDITIGGELVYTGRLSQLVEENGGYFDPIYDVQSGEELDMVITAHMAEDAGNQYQGLSMSCDLTVYATQNDTPVPGEPEGTAIHLGSTSSFNVEGYNTSSQVNFDWDWTPDDSFFGFEYYEIAIKHETGDTTTQIEEARIFIFPNEQVISTDGIDEDDVSVNWGSDIVRINRAAFPADWEGFEVRLSGHQDGGTYETIPYQYWSLDR